MSFPPPPRLALSPSTGHQPYLLSWVEEGNAYCRVQSQGWEKKRSFIQSGFSLPKLPGTGLDRRTGRKSPSSEEPSAERRRESQGPEPAMLGGSRHAGDGPGSPHLLLTYCLLAAFFELTSTREAPPATCFPPAREVCPRTRQRAGKGAWGPLRTPCWPGGTRSPLHPEMLGCSQDCLEHLLASPLLSSLPKFLSIMRLSLSITATQFP